MGDKPRGYNENSSYQKYLIMGKINVLNSKFGIDPLESETHVWAGRSSQLVNFKVYFVCDLLLLAVIYLGANYSNYIFYAAIPLVLIMVYAYFFIKLSTYQITDQRVIRRTGVFTITTFNIELYRIKDVHLTEPFLYRIFGLGNLRLISSQQTTNVFEISAINQSRQLQDVIRKLVEKRRTEKGVAEFDTGIQDFPNRQ